MSGKLTKVELRPWLELLKQSIAARQERIKELWGLDQQQLKAATKNPKEKQRKKQELKAQKLKPVLDSVRELAEDDKIVARISELRVELRELGEDDKVFDRIFDRIRELVELAGLQDREIEYLTQFRRELERIRHYYPEQLQSLSSASLAAELQPVLAGQRRKRSVGLIEWEFGGAGEAWWRKASLLSGLPYEPTCLDEILRGSVGERRTLPGTVSPLTGKAVVIDTLVDMERLKDLFGLDRKRFPKELQLHKRRVGKEIVYNWRGVVEIMRALLSENEKPGGRKKPGPPLRIWPKPALRARVLGGLEERINVVRLDAEIADAFLALIHP